MTERKEGEIYNLDDLIVGLVKVSRLTFSHQYTLNILPPKRR